MGAILADATNLGLDRMAESSRGLTIHQLNLVIQRHVRPETYTPPERHDEQRVAGVRVLGARIARWYSARKAASRLGNAS
jgi:hypothetical protein